MSEKKAKKSKTKKPSETPLMKQYNQIKAKYPDALLLFRVGDFYETFGEDAVKASKILGIILTSRNNGNSKIELAGFPHHSLDNYLPKLVRAGERVAICDQLEDPKMTKKIVKRGVTELVTPGVAMSDQVLEHKKNNFLAAVHFDTKTAGVAFLDVSTGEFLLGHGSIHYIEQLLQSFGPAEVLHQKHRKKEFAQNFGEKFYTYHLDDWAFQYDFAEETLNSHFQTKSLKGFGVEHMDYAICSAGAVLQYLNDTEHRDLGHITSLARIEEDQFVWLDRFTIRNLELVHSPHDNGVTLLDVMDQTITPMGGRMLKRWILMPLKNTSAITPRLEAVKSFVQDDSLRNFVREYLNEMGDLERMVSRLATGKISPKELGQMRKTINAILPLKEKLLESKSSAINIIGDQIHPCEKALDLLEERLGEDPPVVIGKGEVIKSGFNDELDEYRTLLHNGKSFLDNMLQRLIEETGITSLKIAFNNVFGYYIEVRNTHKDKVPHTWIRKQTLVNAERYITEELKEYEQKILGAEEKIDVLERRLFQQLLIDLSDYIQIFQQNAQLIGKVDCLSNFAQIAISNNYTLPEVNDAKVIQITKGRHPVIEKQLPVDEPYIANNVLLDPDQQQILMITGPNMSGKSALLRQTALIALMAQIGSYVPAEKAITGCVDKIFTRVGASDNISSGESTFMVEMNETASILNNLSDRSLILLDEIGRGTSTYDGISIAWSIAEFIHQNPKAKAKTLFATHYHELNEMSSTFDRIKNFNVGVKEMGNRIIFTRKLEQGGSEHSFGIHVAKMAGMPKSVVNRANQILEKLESSSVQGDLKQTTKELSEEAAMQLSFFQLDDPTLTQIKEEIENIDIDTLTPVEALMKLNEIKKLTGLK